MNDDRLDDLLDQLPREVEPGRDLWPGIEARLTPRRNGLRLQTRWPLAAAAAVVAAVTLGVLWHRPPTTVVPRMQASNETVRSLPGYIEADVQARARFAADSLRDDPSLSPRTRAIVLRNLDLIEQAIGNVKLALRSDPANPQLLKMLNQLYLDEAATLAAAQEAPSQTQTTRHSL